MQKGNAILGLILAALAGAFTYEFSVIWTGGFLGNIFDTFWLFMGEVVGSAFFVVVALVAINKNACNLQIRRIVISVLLLAVAMAHLVSFLVFWNACGWAFSPQIVAVEADKLVLTIEMGLLTFFGILGLINTIVEIRLGINQRRGSKR